jgi:hypothetical protein
MEQKVEQAKFRRLLPLPAEHRLHALRQTRPVAWRRPQQWVPVLKPELAALRRLMELAPQQRMRRLRTEADSLALQRARKPAPRWPLRRRTLDLAVLQLATERTLLARPRGLPTPPLAKERTQSSAPPQGTKEAAALQRGTEPMRQLSPQRGANGLAAPQRAKASTRQSNPRQRAADWAPLQPASEPLQPRVLARPFPPWSALREFRRRATQTSAPGRSKHRCRGARR